LIQFIRFVFFANKSLLLPLLQQENILSSISKQKAEQHAAEATKRKVDIDSKEQATQKAAAATKRKARNTAADSEFSCGVEGCAHGKPGPFIGKTQAALTQHERSKRHEVKFK
jgi:hypothetical protein